MNQKNPRPICRQNPSNRTPSEANKKPKIPAETQLKVVDLDCAPTQTPTILVREKPSKRKEAKLHRKPSTTTMKPAPSIMPSTTTVSTPTKATPTINEKVTPPPPVKKDTNAALLEMVGKQMKTYSWYYGIMPREEVQDVLKNDGDYIVRLTTLKNEMTLCLSVRTGAEFRHLPVHYKDGKWVLFKESCATVSELLDIFVKKAGYVGKTDAILKQSVPRPDYYLLHENIKLEKRIGGGQFGEVYRGFLTTKDNIELKVAVKQIKGDVNKDAISKFVKEARLMRRCHHPNVLHLYGVAPQEVPIMIVLEFAEGGCLYDYLKTNKDTPNTQLYSFVKDAARGMCYLSILKIVHRDLAARNCLLGARKEVKIADFGLSIETDGHFKMAKLKKVPLRILSPEVIKEGIYSTKSDVWSFGCLVWEIYNFCETAPFPGLTTKQVREKILSNEVPMEPPASAGDNVKTVMSLCFIRDYQERSDFVTILKQLSPFEVPPKPELEEKRSE